MVSEPRTNGHSENEAAGKWCPMARTMGHYSDPVANRYVGEDNPSSARCIASRCMMWRWSSQDIGNCGLAAPHT